MSLEDRSVNDLHATDRLPEYVGGRLPREEREDVEGHLASCTSCAEELKLVEALLAAPEPRLEPSEVKRLYTPLRPRVRRVWSAGVWRAAAGITVVVAGYAVWLASRTEGEVADAWSAEEALAGWATDLAELHPAEMDLRAALGGVDGPAWLGLEGEDLNGVNGPDGPSEELQL